MTRQQRKNWRGWRHHCAPGFRVARVSPQQWEVWKQCAGVMLGFGNPPYLKAIEAAEEVIQKLSRKIGASKRAISD